MAENTPKNVVVNLILRKLTLGRSTIFVNFEEMFSIDIGSRESQCHIKWYLYFTKAMWHSMLVLKLFHGTPMYSQAPQLQQDLFSSHRFNILASIGLFATTLPPWQLESGYITLLLKTLQGLLILTLRYHMILWCLWPHLLSPLLLSSGHTDPFAIPGTCQVCFCFRTCALSICAAWYSSPRCHYGWLLLGSDTAFSVSSILTALFQCNPLLFSSF